MRIHKSLLRDQIVIPDESQIAALIRALLGPSGVHSVVLVGEGSDHWAFDVNGAFIARVRKQWAEHAAAAVAREGALLNVVSRVSPVSVPEIVAAEPKSGLIVYRRLPGTWLLDNS